MRFFAQLINACVANLVAASLAGPGTVSIDFSAHWLLPQPFGVDSRYDPIGATAEPAYRPQASQMKLKATDGYKPKTRLKDPDAKRIQEARDMVFVDKMMS